MPQTPTVPIPPLFLERMQTLLGQEFQDFAESLNLQPKSGLRVNTLKITPQEFQSISPFPLLDPISWCPSAFVLDGENRPGLHPYHMAGLYYLQDPSAMSPAELLNPQPGERVLDLAAAPGGKTTQLSALMQGAGLVLANEIKNKRVGHLAQNAERWGAGNIVISNETPERLADHFGGTFDRVLIDAPCSGEGMFRKDMGARADWSPEMIAGCAVRQKNIIRVGAKLVRPGGWLLYSTCTFAPEEDEAVIDQLLQDFPDFSVVELPRFTGFVSGKPEWLPGTSGQIAGAVRLFPHLITGEGHFVCLLKRSGQAEIRSPRENKKYSRKSERIDLRHWRAFEEETLAITLDEDRLKTFGERLYYVPEIDPDYGNLRIIHRGVWLGTLKKDRFEPAHPLALFLKKGEAKKSHPLSASSSELASYLRGETISSSLNGWAVVTVDGFPLGWGKGVQGILKNHYPRGWIV